MEKSLRERYQGAALITGASSGLGVAFARRLAREGFDVVLVARRKDRLEALAEELVKKHGIKAQPIAQDLSAENSAEVLTSVLNDHRIEVGVLVNNAGYGSYGYFHELDPVNEIRMVDLNCRTPVALTTAFLPAMLERGNGAIVFVASVAAYQPTPFFATYGATKAFNLHIGEALWAELRPFGIDVIALSPGYTKTEFQEVAGVGIVPPVGIAEPEEVIDLCFARLGRAPSAVPQLVNKFTVNMVRMMPRATIARLAHAFTKPAPKTES